MVLHLSRRKFVNAVGVGAAGLVSALPFARGVQAQKVQLTGVHWGGPWLEGAKAVAAKQDKVDLKWELHTGGAAAIIPKIKAAWPNAPYDFVAQFDAAYYSWIAEDWAEPVTPEEIPNLRDVPEELFYKNEKGQNICIPLSLSAMFFGYRKDICPFPIKKMEDLLDPRLKGKLVVRDAVQGLNNNMAHFAIAFGGSPDNLEPGWEFLKKVAKAGNIARFTKTDVEFINSMTSGESVAGFSIIGNWGKVAEQFPVEFVIRDRSEAPGFQAGLVQEGFVIVKTSPRKREVKEFLNFFIGPENNGLYNKHVNMAPANSKSEATELARSIVFKSRADRDKFTIRYNWKLLSDQRTESIKRFEQEVVPLTR